MKMGIRGLTTYINKNSWLMEDHELHGSHLVIDGLGVAASLFFSAHCNSSFAGDLDRFSRVVSIFFDRLSTCKVTPIVLLDGGSETKKMNTLAKRKLSHMDTAASWTLACEGREQIGSIALDAVFEAVVREKGVKMVRCVLEADASIAAVARILDCPVLSNDSDFYIFGVKYIPVDSLAKFVARGSWGRTDVIRCRLFRPEFVSRAFRGFDLCALPLIAVLFGNDYTTRDTFERFFAGVQLSNWSKRLFNTEQRRIDTIFRWLRDHDLENATAAILSKMPKNRRRELLSKIEFVVNEYLVLPFEILEPLELAERYRTEVARQRRLKRFQFSRDVDALDASEFWTEEQLADSEFSTEEQVINCVDSSSVQDTGEVKPVPEPDCASSLVDTWPAWFVRHYDLGNLPAFIVDMMTYGSFVVAVHIEDFEYPSPSTMIMKIVGVIHGLLVAGRPDESARGLSYTIRYKRDFVDRHVDTVKGTRTMRFPALSDLAETTKLVRKQIFDDTLEISGFEALVHDVPVEWRLYVIAIVYWMRQPDEPLRNARHMHAVLFAMLSGVVDRKIGAFYRSMKLFNDRYGKTLVDIKSNRHDEQPDLAYEDSDSIVEALKSVRFGDCLLAAPIIIKLCVIDIELLKDPQNFNVTIVHVFAQLLSCIKAALHLNALLGYPYKPVNIGDFFNGTMLYNLFTGSEKVSDVEAWNCEIVRESPSIRRLLKLLTAKVKEIIAVLGDCGSADSRKLSEDQPSKVEVLPDEVSAAQSQSIDRSSSFILHT